MNRLYWIWTEAFKGKALSDKQRSVSRSRAPESCSCSAQLLKLNGMSQDKSYMSKRNICSYRVRAAVRKERRWLPYCTLPEHSRSTRNRVAGRRHRIPQRPCPARQAFGTAISNVGCGAHRLVYTRAACLKL